MKFNKWTLGLAAIGVVSLASVAQADEKMSAVQSALSSTTISGYVDTSMQWNLGSGNAYLPPYKFGGQTKADGFNLNVVQISISKPLDESDWAAGYKADLWFGPDANALNTGSVTSGDVGGENSDFAVRQAYVALRMPIGNGLDWKVGVFDSIIGYESVEDGNNPNHTRSYGHSIEPQTHTGLLATYRFNDMVSVAGGVANTVYASINSRAQFGSSGKGNGFFSQFLQANGIDNSSFQDQIAGANQGSEASKTYMGSIALTAPDDWGWAKGSTLYGGVVHGYNNSLGGTGIGGTQTSWYAGATVATPVAGLKLGIAFDYLDVSTENDNLNNSISPDAWALGGYASYQATEKLSLHARVEYYEQQLLKDNTTISINGNDIDVDEVKPEVIATTVTVQYDLWKNVISRLEFRWDHSYNGDLFGERTVDFDGTDVVLPTTKDAYMIAANIIYKF